MSILSRVNDVRDSSERMDLSLEEKISREFGIEVDISLIGMTLREIEEWIRRPEGHRMATSQTKMAEELSKNALKHRIAS